MRRLCRAGKALVLLCGVNPIWTHSPHIIQLCGLCCVEETTDTLVNCDSLLPVTRLCGLCCVEETTAKLVYCGTFLLSQLCSLCCVEETTAKLVNCDSLLPVTQLCGLCCAEETTDRLVYCDRFLPISALIVHFLLLSGKKMLFVGCLTTQQHASVSQGRICSDKLKC